MLGLRRSWLLALLLLGIGGLSRPAAAQRAAPIPGSQAKNDVPGEHCLGEEKQKLLLEHYMAGSINPLGIGNLLRLSLCTPLITSRRGLLYDLTNVEFGALLTNSPTDVQAGGFISLVPLSFLVLKAEATGFYIWPIPLQGAGFIKTTDPSDFSKALLSPSPFGANPATTAYGARALIGATLQAQFSLGKWVDVSVVDGASYEYWKLASDGFAQFLSDQQAAGRPQPGFYSARRDVILLGSGDGLVTNSAVVLVGLKPHPNLAIRIGATDDLVYVPSHGYLGNIAAALVVVSVKNLRDLAKSFSFFIRAGAFTHHAWRVGTGATLALGLDITYELFGRTARRPSLTSDPPADGRAPVPSSDPVVASPSAS
jgi:hypothetical protein